MFPYPVMSPLAVKPFLITALVAGPKTRKGQPGKEVHRQRKWFNTRLAVRLQVWREGRRLLLAADHAKLRWIWGRFFSVRLVARQMFGVIWLWAVEGMLFGKMLVNLHSRTYLYLYHVVFINYMIILWNDYMWWSRRTNITQRSTTNTISLFICYYHFISDFTYNTLIPHA